MGPTFTLQTCNEMLNHILQKRVMKKGIDSDVSLFDDTKKFYRFTLEMPKYKRLLTIFGIRWKL